MRERWAGAAVAELDAALDWLEANHGVAHAALVAEDVARAVARACGNPYGYAWVGTVYPGLEALERSFRRVVARRSRFTVVIRASMATNEVLVLAVRGPGQLPPSRAALAARDADLPSG